MIASMFYLTEIDASIEQEPTGMHPTGSRRVKGCNKKIELTTGWKPGIPMQQTLLNILSDWDARVAADAAAQ
ncbi:hypothetical protein CAter10_3677 [Collimonas arenae]|uniref:hypothetical protein n=1 Tax=Collimonas arenae TaxID=279058 RepID=UPI00078C4302|nr:hypothetical protein [Collimonas arenae]AMP01152.1 hypothetical protein CAter10_3677 [Collimonas arenae]